MKSSFKIINIFLILTIMFTSIIVFVGCENELNGKEIVSENIEVLESESVESNSTSKQDLEDENLNKFDSTENESDGDKDKNNKAELIISEIDESDEDEFITIDSNAWYNTTPAWKSSSYCGDDYWGYRLYNFYGDVMKSVDYSSFLEQEVNWVNTSYCYDDDGRILLILQESLNSDEIYLMQYKYNEHGDVIKSFVPNGTNADYISYIYDDNGNIINCSIISYVENYTDVPIYYTIDCEWDDLNRIKSIEVTQDFDEWAEFHGRPEPGEEDWIHNNWYYEYIGDNTKITRHYVDGEYVSMEIEEYNIEGKVIKRSFYNIYNNEEIFSSIINYFYDSNGNVNAELIESGSSDEVTTYTYLNEYYDYN